MQKKLLNSVTLAIGLALGSTSVLAKNLIYCSESSPEGFDPAIYTAGTTFDASSHTVYNGLIEFTDGTTDIEPALAEKWDISSDGLEYTFYLRPNVKFHTTKYFKPSRDFNADDVLLTFNRQKDKNHPWHTYTPGADYTYFNGMGMNLLIKDVVKIDDLTVKIILNESNAPFLANLAMPHMAVISKEYTDQLAKANKKSELNQNPVGTGPFIFTGYQKDAAIRYQANKQYWGKKVKFDNLIFSITPDPMVRLQKLKSGECHIDGYPQITSIEDIKSDKNLQLIEQPGLNVGYWSFNTLIKPFDNVDVRRALSMAVDRKTLVDAVFQGAGEIANSPIPPTIWSYKKDIAAFEYNPEEAKKLLEKAGVKNLEVKIMAMPVSRPYMPNARRAAEFMQTDLAKIGVKAEIVSYEWGEYLKKIHEKDRVAVAMIGWTGDNGDPDNFLATLLSCQAAEDGSNYSFWCDKEYDKLVTDAAKITDKAERTKLYERAQERFREQNPWLPLAYSRVFKATSNKVKGFKAQPLGSNRFSNVEFN